MHISHCIPCNALPIIRTKYLLVNEWSIRSYSVMISIEYFLLNYNSGHKSEFYLLILKFP